MNFIKAIFLVSLCSCISQRIHKEVVQMENEFQDHVGLLIYDPIADKNIVEYNSAKYFTPASNTKILTLYGSLLILGDSLPSIYYKEIGDSLIVWGTGDPSFLDEKLAQSAVFEFLRQSKKQIYFSDANFKDHTFGAGWAWDDYSYTFSSEKSPLPIYANRLTLKKEADNDYPELSPATFKQEFYLSDSTSRPGVAREYGSNTFFYEPSDGAVNRQFPFKYSGLLTAQLLSDTLHRPIGYISMPIPDTYSTIFHPQADSIYQMMMQDSDNFIAEQLLLVNAGVIHDTLNTDIAIKYIKEQYFSDMPDEALWRDGSGLSRYNLFTPRSIVWLWNDLLRKKGKEELFRYLAQGGVSGTLKNYYKAPSPYIFGKTGTLSNNHNLSGFLITKKKKLLIFSFMNNNYPTASLPVKKKMEQLLWRVHLNY